MPSAFDPSRASGRRSSLVNYPLVIVLGAAAMGQVPTYGTAALRGANPAGPAACLPRAIASASDVRDVVLDASDHALTYCVVGITADTHEPTERHHAPVAPSAAPRCFRADLTTGTLVATPAAHAAVPAAVSVRSAHDGVEVCAAPGRCHAVRIAPGLRVDRSTGPGPGDVVVASDDGATIVALRDEGVGEHAPTTIETYAVATGTRSGSFHVTSGVDGQHVSIVAFVGPSLAVRQCSAAGACESRLVDPATGAVRGDVLPVDVPNALRFRIDGDRWVFFGGGRAVWLDARSGRVERSAPLSIDDFNGPAATLRSPDAVVAVQHSGDVAVIDPATGGVLRRIHLAVCPVDGP